MSAKHFVRVVTTDYGTHPISDKTEQAYIQSFGKKRSGKYTKKSLARAEHELAKDVSAAVRLCWLTNKDLPKGLL